MPASCQDYITLCYNNYPEQKEYVFSMKGRPFSMLSSQKLPIPTSSLIDFNLVSDLGLRMTDLQCSKFSYGGQKFRILGKISQTVQTIKDGVVSGTVHLRASVVEGLRTVFDSHSIAGKKMSEILTRKIASAVSSPTSSSSSPASSVSARSPKSPSKPTNTNGPDTPKFLPPVPVPRRSLSSPKPLNSHYTNTYAAPQRKEKLPEGMDIPVRTLSLKPDDCHLYGKVRSVQHRNGPGPVQVDYGDSSGQVFTLNTIQPLYVHKELHVGDPVLLKRYPDLQKARAEHHDSKFPILMVYNEREEAQLKSLGVLFPDCPPNLHSDGNRG